MNSHCQTNRVHSCVIFRQILHKCVILHKVLHICVKFYVNVSLVKSYQETKKQQKNILMTHENADPIKGVLMTHESLKKNK